MIKRIEEIKIGQFFEAYQAVYYKRCKAYSVKINRNGSTRLVLNSNIQFYVEAK